MKAHKLTMLDFLAEFCAKNDIPDTKEILEKEVLYPPIRSGKVIPTIHDGCTICIHILEGMEPSERWRAFFHYVFKIAPTEALRGYLLEFAKYDDALKKDIQEYLDAAAFIDAVIGKETDGEN